MGFFSRNKKKSGDDGSGGDRRHRFDYPVFRAAEGVRAVRDGGPRDGLYPMVSVAEAAYIKQLLRDAFAKYGVDTIIHESYLEADNGARFGFDNVMRTCNQAESPATWPEMADLHAWQMTRHRDDARDDDPQRVLANTFVRLQGADMEYISQLPHTGFAPGIVQTLVEDLPETLRSLGDTEIENLGGWATVHSHGVDNLLRETDFKAETVERTPGVRLTLVHGNSVHVGSLALVLPEIAERLGLPEAGPAGYFLAVPCRHMYMVHNITNGQALDALTQMVTFSASQYNNQPGAISPNVLWWSGRDYQQVSFLQPDESKAEVRLSPELTAALESVGG